MKISRETWAILSLNGLKDNIDTNPDYQRPSVWKKSQKQLLIDSILRGYDLPKFYLEEISEKKYTKYIKQNFTFKRKSNSPTTMG